VTPSAERAPSVARTVPAPFNRLPGFDRLPPAARPWVFSVDTDTIQVTWHALGPGPLRLQAADTVVEVLTDGGPGAVELRGLPPATALELRLDGDAAQGLPRHWRRPRFATLAPPPGEEIFRFATISDLQVGEIAFGFRHRMIEHPVPDEAHPVRATRAALNALTEWGAQLALVKGDLTHSGRTKDWDTIGRLLNTATVPVELIPGNHDQYGAPGEPSPYDALLHLGHDLTRHYESLDVPGLRIVLVDSTADGHRSGHVHHVTRGVLDALASAGTPAFVTMHHYAQRTRIPFFWPPGIDSAEANAFLAKIAAVQPATFISSGHTPSPPAPLRRSPRPHRGRLPEGLPGYVGRLRGARGRHPPGRAARGHARLAALDGLLRERGAGPVGHLVPRAAEPPLLQPPLAALSTPARQSRGDAGRGIGTELADPERARLALRASRPRASAPIAITLAPGDRPFESDRDEHPMS